MLERHPGFFGHDEHGRPLDGDAVLAAYFDCGAFWGNIEHVMSLTLARATALPAARRAHPQRSEAGLTAWRTQLSRSSSARSIVRRRRWRRSSASLEGLSNEAMRVQVRAARLAAFPTARIRGALTGLSGAFTTLRGHLGGAWSGLTSLMPPLAALGAGTSLAGLFELVRHVAEARHEVAKMAETIGIAPPQMARLNFAARMTGTNVKSMQVGLTKLNKVMGDTVRGKNKDAAELFRQIGISTQELASGNAATILPKIAASFQATHSATMRAAMAQALFGRGWREMAPLLFAGPEEMRAWIAQLDRLGYKFTQVDDNNLTAFRSIAGRTSTL